MATGSKDVKKLWGLAAGQCSSPSCNKRCIEFLDGNPTVTGEMAHVIAKQPGGPRSIGKSGGDNYDNLILLCPSCHKKIDRYPESFPPKVLLDWKTNHEKKVAAVLESPVFETLNDVAKHIKKLLIENRTAWENYGPESSEAVANPLSNLAWVWSFIKLNTIIPNNRLVIKSIQKNKHLFDVESYRAACEFIAHAEGFECNCYDRTEGIPRFPKHFDEIVTHHAGI